MFWLRSGGSQAGAVSGNGMRLGKTLGSDKFESRNYERKHYGIHTCVSFICCCFLRKVSGSVDRCLLVKSLVGFTKCLPTNRRIQWTVCLDVQSDIFMTSIE